VQTSNQAANYCSQERILSRLSKRVTSTRSFSSWLPCDHLSSSRILTGIFVGANMTELNRRELLLGSAATWLALSPAAAATPAGPPLWLVRRGSAKLYFFGQLPVRADSAWQSEQVLRAFDASTEFWTENPDPASGPPPAPRAPSGPKLVDSITQDEMRRLRAALVREGLKEDALDATPLSDAYSAVSYLQDHALGVDYSSIPERVLRNKAKQAGKAVHSEWASFDEIAHFRDSMAADTRIALDLELFRRGLTEAEDVDNARQRLDGWLHGDLRALNAMERNQGRRYPLISKLVGADRNKAWVARTAGIMQRNATAFACQGIGHLLGSQSIQVFLQRAGYQVSRAA
jgi:uncharacterized protein YbaP (TraB family)